MVFEESWGKVGGILQKLAIFEKGLSRFCHGGFVGYFNISLYETTDYTDFMDFFADLNPTVLVGNEVFDFGPTKMMLNFGFWREEFLPQPGYANLPRQARARRERFAAARGHRWLREF